MKNKDRRIAGALLVLIPMVFWMFTYIRFDCAGGRCVMDYKWLIGGFLLSMFGLFILLAPGSEEEEK